MGSGRRDARSAHHPSRTSRTPAVFHVPDRNPSANGCGVNDRLLTIALWISLILHLAFVLLLPAPATVEARSAIGVQVEWITAPPSATEISEEVSAPVVSAPEVTAPAPESAAPGPQEAIAPVEPEFDAPVVLAAPDVTPRVPLPAPPENPFDAPPVDREEPTPTEFDADRVEELLQSTQKQIGDRSRETRYRMIEVRERVMRALETVHPGPSVVVEDKARYRCLLQFRVDSEGYIFDLGLRLPQGSELDAATIERAIGSISPLPSPPPGIGTPIEFEWRVNFLE
mgnify:CR=1 FL=1